jgi:hypothetical protein
MNLPAPQTSGNNGSTSARDLFALTDEQILQMEPDAQDVETFAGERTDRMDPLREDLDLLDSAALTRAPDGVRSHETDGANANDGPKAVPTNTSHSAEVAGRGSSTAESSTTAPANVARVESTEAPAWLTERMNDPQIGAEARALWDGMQVTRKEASAFREVFAKPEDARVAAERARTLDDFDRAYFGAAGTPPEQIAASRSQLATQMLREDPAAFREMVFAGLRALEAAAQQGSSADVVAPPFRAASSDAHSTPTHKLNAQTTASQHASAAPQPSVVQQASTSRQQQAQPQQNAQDSRVAAYAAFERATNAELERGVGGAIDRSLQAALPNAARSENSAALKERLGAAIRQDVEKALQGDRALGEQVARVLAGQRLDDAARAQVVRLISDRAQQLVPGSARKVLADWTQTTLASYGNRVDHSNARQSVNGAKVSTGIATSAATQKKASQPTERGAPAQRTARKIDYRRVSDDDILDS